MRTPRVASQLVAVTVIASLFIAACGPTAAPTGAPAAGPTRKIPMTPALQQVVDAAKNEGGVLYLLNQTYTVQGAIDEWSRGMTEQFGFPIRIDGAPGPAPSEFAPKLVEEYNAGRPASTDVFLGDDVNTLPQMRDGAVTSVNWKDLAPWLPDSVIGLDNSYLLFYSRIGAVLYNTDLVKRDDVPRRLRDLLNPKWKGQIATTPYVFGFREAAGLYGRDEEMTSFLRDFQRSGNIAGFMRCGEDERLASGEFAMLAIGCGTDGVQEIKEKGAPVDYAILEDLAIMSFWAVSVPKHSAHPNLAKLYAVYAMTREAQDIQWKYHRQDLHYLEGSRVANELKPKLANIEPQVVTNDILTAKFDELDRLRPQLVRALRGD